MIKQAYFRGLMKVAQVQPNMAQKLWRGLTSSSTGSKVTRALLAGLPAATVSKLLGLGWGTSAAIGAGSATAAWYAPKLSKRYRLEQIARDKGVSAQMLDRLYYADTKVNGVNQLDSIRRALIGKGDAIMNATDSAKRVYAKASPQQRLQMQVSMLDQLDKYHASTKSPGTGFNPEAVVYDMASLVRQDVLNNTDRSKAFIDLIKHK